MDYLRQEMNPNGVFLCTPDKTDIISLFSHLLLANTVIKRPPSKELSVLCGHGLINPPCLVCNVHKLQALLCQERRPPLVGNVWQHLGTGLCKVTAAVESSFCFPGAVKTTSLQCQDQCIPTKGPKPTSRQLV